MGHLLSLNGDVDGELLCLAMTSSLIALRESNRGEGSPNLSSDVDDVGGRVSNCRHRSEDETDKVGEAQERGEEKVVMGVW